MDLVTLGMVICLNLQDVKRHEAGQIRLVQSQSNSCFKLKKRHTVLEVRETSRFLAVTLNLGTRVVTGYSSKNQKD